MSRLPKRPRQHIIEKKSRQFVERILPAEWLVESGQDDYGIDLVVEIVVDEQVTGAHFLMQLKGTDELTVREGGYIAHNCSTSALRYYLERPELIIYLVYDAEKKEGYWLWIQDFIRSLKPGWQNQKTVTVQISLTNMFNDNAVNEITQRVLRSHEYAKWLLATQTAQNPYFRYDFGTIGQGFQVDVYPKYLGAEQDRPVEIKGTFRFDQSPEAQAALCTLEKAITTGASAEFDSRFFEGFGIPEAFSDLFAHLGGEFRIDKIRIGTAKTDDRLLAKVSVLDQENRPLAEIPFVDFRVVQAGSEEITFSNEEQGLPLIIAMVMNARDQITSFSMKIDLIGKNVVQIRDFVQVQQALTHGRIVKLTILNNGLSAQSEILHRQIPEIEEELKTLINDLAYIQERTNRLITWPGQISLIEGQIVKDVVNILQTGGLQRSISEYKFEVDKHAAKALAEAYAYHGQMQLGFDYLDSPINLMGTKLSLGSCKIILPITRPKEATLERFRILEQQADDIIVPIEVDVGEPGMLIFFPQWLPQQSQTITATNIHASESN